jgi:hypothetical protein
VYEFEKVVEFMVELVISDIVAEQVGAPRLGYQGQKCLQNQIVIL